MIKPIKYQNPLAQGLPSQSGPSHQDEVVIDLREYLYLIQQHLWGVLSFALACSVLAILVIFSLKPIYLGETTLLIEANDSNIISIEDVYQLGTGKNEYYFTQFEILKSRELAVKIIERNPEIFEQWLQDEASDDQPIWAEFFPQSSPTEQEKSQQKVALLTNSLKIKPIRNTQLVVMGVESGDPEAAAHLANELAQVYIENNLEARLAMTQQAATWLAGRIDGLKEKLQESEEKLQQYREREDLLDLDGEKTLASRELEEISTKLSEARKQRVEAGNIAAQVRKLSGKKMSDIEALSAIPAVLQHTLVQTFKEQEGIAEQKLSELSKRYGYKHPKIISAKSDLVAAQKNTAKQIFKIVEGIQKEYELAQATDNSLSKEVDRLKVLVQKNSRKQYRLGELMREVSVNQQLYETFFSRIKETSEAGGMQTANARVIDAAIAPIKPIKPKKVLLSVLAIALSLLGGILLAFIRDALDRTVKSRDDVIIKLHSQLLGVLPLLSDKQRAGENVGTMFLKSGIGTFAEAIRTIRTGVVLSGLDNPHKVLVVTSSVPGEGKTTVSSNLAMAFGQMGKTLLIDADMRRPSVATNFGIKLSAPGLSNLVAETAEPKECIHRIEDMGIDIIPAGVVPPNPLELLSSKRFATVLASLEKHYDRIIIDTAPCEVVSDALILSTFAGALIYVVKADSTNIKAVKSGVSRLREINAPLTGIVLNQINVEKESAYGYGRYYGGYYDYYGYSSDGDDSKVANAFKIESSVAGGAATALPSKHSK